MEIEKNNPILCRHSSKILFKMKHFEIWMVYLEFNWCDGKNPEIFSEMEEIKVLAKFDQGINFSKIKANLNWKNQ